MRTRVTLRAGIVIVVMQIALHAQTGATAQPLRSASTYIDSNGGLTVNAAVAQALQREPSLQVARAKIDAANGQRAQAELRPNPSAEFSLQGEPAGTDNQTRLEVQWPLDLSRKAGRVAVADRELDAARHAAADRERILAADVRMAYGEVAVAIRTLSVTEQVLDATKRQQMLVSSRVEQGAAPPLERDMLRVEALRLESDRVLQDGEVERRLIQLKRLLGLSPEAPLALSESLEQLDRSEVPAAEGAPDRSAISRRPDILEAESRVALADAHIDRAKREGRADVSLFGMYMRMDAGFPQRGFTDTGELARVHGIFHYVGGGAMVTLPLLNRNQGTVAAAQADRVGAASQLEATRLFAASEVAAARSRDAHARQALQAYGDDAMPLATRNLDTVRQTYELGRATLLDVLAEQRRYLDVQRAYTDVLREAYQARQALKQALGETR